MALNLWTVGEEAMAKASRQAVTGNSCICVHTAAGPGKIKGKVSGSGDMWIATMWAADQKMGLVESTDVLLPAYQRVLVAEERG
jgi:hypothetical protein